MTGHHDITKETARARELFARHGGALEADQALAHALEAYRAEIERNWALMDELQVVRVCGECAGKKAESCCFNGAERWYYAELLILNLLMGVELPDEQDRLIPHQCLYIGPTGCMLRARWSICINFFCPDMIAELGSDAIGRLRRQAGQEITAGIAAELALTRLLDNLAHS